MALNHKQPEKNYSAIKTAIGSLYRATNLSTDPAQTLQFNAGLINGTRSFLVQKLEARVPDSAQIPATLNAILKTIVNEWDGDHITDDGIDDMDARIDAIFKSPPMARYGLDIYRDSLYCDQLLDRWQIANHTYIQTHNSWILSNSILAPMNKQLTEIIVRHDLMSFPMADPFNMDNQGGNMGAIMKRAQEIQVNGRPE
jgi:hypothetical protein